MISIQYFEKRKLMFIRFCIRMFPHQRISKCSDTSVNQTILRDRVNHEELRGVTHHATILLIRETLFNCNYTDVRAVNINYPACPVRAFRCINDAVLPWLMTGAWPTYPFVVARQYLRARFTPYESSWRTMSLILGSATYRISTHLSKKLTDASHKGRCNTRMFYNHTVIITKRIVIKKLN